MRHEAEYRDLSICSIKKKTEMEWNEFLSLLIHYSSQVIILAYLGSNAYKGLLATPVF